MAFRTIRKGDPVLAEDINALYTALARLEVRVAPPLGMAGNVIHFAGQGQGMWIQLTARSSGAFAWTEQIPAAGGTWTAGTQSGTTANDPAREINANTSLPAFPFIVRAWRAPQTGEILFQASSC